MLEPHCEVDADSATYELGWRIIYPNSSMRIVHHTGWWDGYRSNLVYFEKEDITLVINTNWYKGPFFNHAYLKRFSNWFNKDGTTDK